MSELFVHLSIDIQAEAAGIWHVLTDQALAATWVHHFEPRFYFLSSDWQKGSRVEWQTNDRTALVDGFVFQAEPFDTLAFSVHDMSGRFDTSRSETDGIFYTLTRRLAYTTLSLRQGDFSSLGEQAPTFLSLTKQSWTRTLPVIKQLAESI